MTLLLWTVVATSLVGSLHCAAMCGPFVAFYAGTDHAAGWASHAAYNGGRLFTYVALGIAGGAVGAAVDLAGSMVHVQRTAALVAGAVILAWGGVSLARAMGIRIPGLVGGAQMPRGLVTLRRRPPVVRAGALGLLTAALPCGWLYAFVVAAASTGTPLRGGAVMAAFWLGTVPMLVGLGLTARRIASLLGRRMPVVTAAALIAVGAAALFVRAPMIGRATAAPAVREFTTTTDYIERLGETEPPCHAEH